MGTVGRVAGTALEYSPWGLAEKGAGKVFETAARPIVSRIAAKATRPTVEVAERKISPEFEAGVQRVTDVISKYTGRRWGKPKEIIGSPQGLIRLPKEARAELYGALSPIVGASSARVMRDWRPTKIMLFLDNYPTRLMTPEEVAQHYLTREIGAAKFKPSLAWKQMSVSERVALTQSLGLEGKIGSRAWRNISAADKKRISDRLLQEPVEATMAETAARGAGEIPPTIPPTKTAAAPSGFNPEQQGAVDRLVGLFKGYRQLARQTRQLRKPVHAARAGE